MPSASGHDNPAWQAARLMNGTTSPHVEEMFGPAFSLHGKTINGTCQLGHGFFSISFTDGTELCIRIEEDRDGSRLGIAVIA